MGVLTDPTRTLIARYEVSTADSEVEPAWTAQAMAAGQILIAYGTRVGVRVPDGVPASRYGERYRATSRTDDSPNVSLMEIASKLLVTVLLPQVIRGARSAHLGVHIAQRSSRAITEPRTRRRYRGVVRAMRHART